MSKVRGGEIDADGRVYFPLPVDIPGGKRGARVRGGSSAINRIINNLPMEAHLVDFGINPSTKLPYARKYSFAGQPGPL